MRKILETERLVLREIGEADLPMLHRIFSDPESMRYYPAVKSFDETAAWFGRLAFRSYAENGFGLWAIVGKAGGEIIGDCGITLQSVPGGIAPEIGYHLRREHLGRGYAAEAASACRDHAFEVLGLDRIVSIVSPENTPSLRVAARVHQRWETYRTRTSAGAEVNRFLFVSERLATAAKIADAGARIAEIEAQARSLQDQSRR
ncbi:GNAT family N-acetyltransferase [Rhizobium terrae]|uniref:GNAT family N-acetyltransferase n=1 Tax=Rhizobium terrae TaxID=2171756 RepID=UPI000E3E431B|nr:GNAT family N-acetyltransferase [Rhizobium terrae]